MDSHQIIKCQTLFIAVMSAMLIATGFGLTYMSIKSVERDKCLDNCQMICHKADAEVHALKIQKKILESQVRQLKALIPTNVTLKIELSDIIDSVDNEPCEGCIREGIIKVKDRK